MTLALFLQGQSVSIEQVFGNAARDLQAGRYAEAEAGFLRVLASEPNNLGALGNLGVVYNRQNRPQKAVDTYRRALKLAPNEPGLVLNLGLAHLQLDDCASAKPLFARLTKTASPMEAQASELLAICQLQTGEIALATAGLETLAAKGGASPGVYHALALAYVKQKNLPKAQEVFDRLMVELSAAQAHFLEGRVWYDAALFDRAIASYEKAAAADRNLRGLALETGKTHISLRNDTAALEHLRAAVAQNSSDVEARYFLGALLVQQGQNAEGAPLLESVVEVRPDLWGTYYYLGKAQLSLGKAAAALPLLQRAASRAPGESAVQYQIGRAFQALGRKAEAQQAFARVAKTKAAARTETIVMK